MDHFEVTARTIHHKVHTVLQSPSTEHTRLPTHKNVMVILEISMCNILCKIL